MALFSLSEPLFDVEFFPVAGLGNKYDMRGKKGQEIGLVDFVE